MCRFDRAIEEYSNIQKQYVLQLKITIFFLKTQTINEKKLKMFHNCI